jgi:hypothetical protein
MANQIPRETYIEAEKIIRGKYKDFLHIENPLNPEKEFFSREELIERYARNFAFYDWYSTVDSKKQTKPKSDIDLAIKNLSLNAYAKIQKMIKDHFSEEGQTIIKNRMKYLIESEFYEKLPILSIQEWLSTNNVVFSDDPNFFKSPIDKCCSYCKKSDTKLKVCSRCKAVYYCSKECQKASWLNHKKECNNPQE